MLSSYLWTTGQILCVGDDGHIEVELAGLSGICQEPGKIQGARNNSLDLSHCGICEDVPVDVDPVTRKGPGTSLLVHYSLGKHSVLDGVVQLVPLLLFKFPPSSILSTLSQVVLII